MTRIGKKRALTPMVFCLLASAAVAQQSVVDHCRKTSSDADRIACLEAALLVKEAALPAIAVERRAEPAVDDTPPVVAPPPDAVDKSAAERIGAQQVEARNLTREQQLKNLEKAAGLVVAAYETVPYEKLQVTLENGQVWRQITGDPQKIRVDLRRNQTVDIEESSLSGYKMQLNEMRRTLRVERVR